METSQGQLPCAELNRMNANNSGDQYVPDVCTV
jgi:hypothetical protein